MQRAVHVGAGLLEATGLQATEDGTILSPNGDSRRADAQRYESRGPNGEPSASDFSLIELPTIAEACAERFDELFRVYPDRDDLRYLVAVGRLVGVGEVVAESGRCTMMLDGRSRRQQLAVSGSPSANGQ